MRILVLGLSGIGKTTACHKFAAAHPEFAVITASELIGRALGATREQLASRSEAEILRNQTILSDALEREISARTPFGVLIDGQCVIDNGQEVVVIPTAAVAALRPTGCILLDAGPDLVMQRRQADGRFRPSRSKREIADQLLLVRRAVRRYADELHLPLLVRDATEAVCLGQAIDELFGPAD